MLRNYVCPIIDTGFSDRKVISGKYPHFGNTTTFLLHLIEVNVSVKLKALMDDHMLK